MKAVGYIRVSTEEQARDGVSLDNQRKRIEAFCVAKDWDLTHIYVDEGKTGGNLKREGVQDLLRECQRRTFDIVVIYKLDRLTRSVKDLGYLIELFDKAFPSVITLILPQQTASWFCISWAALHSGSAILSLRGQRTRWHTRNQSARYILRCLWDTRLIENKKELAVVKKIRNAGASYQRIADKLNSAGITAKRGSKWYSASVRYVFNNALYA